MKAVLMCLLLSVTVFGNGQSGNGQSAEAPQLKPGWKRIEAQGHFSFHLPETMQPVEIHGIDSYVGEYKDDRMKVVFDYGMYSNPLSSYSKSPEYKEINKPIGGLPAKIVFCRQTDPAAGYQYFAGVYFASVKPGTEQTSNKLMLSAEFNSADDWQTAQTIFESIRFKSTN
jgi:hypothetical protein